MKPNNVKASIHGSVIDIFCGCGALSHGFFREGFKIACGYDIDESCRYPFEINNDAPFVCQNVSTLSPRAVAREFNAGLPRILMGCAPCQPFSAYSRNQRDSKWTLLLDFSRLVKAIKPEIVSMENVPRLRGFQGGQVFDQFVNDLDEAGYEVRWKVVYCPDFGVPQNRYRLVLIASRLGTPLLPEPVRKKHEYTVVRDAIDGLSKLEAGESDSLDPLHKCSRMSELNLKRIRASVPGGTWLDWDESLLAACHKVSSGQSFHNVYGRMRWDQPSPTITTQFYAIGHGRFGHPEQDRALSLREGALLQSFPLSYKFLKIGTEVVMQRIARQIGNAVPISLAQAIARAIKLHLQDLGA